jgi:hypothetical protein
MRLDAAAQRALHVFPARGDGGASFSLYGLMCKARTSMGKRRLKVGCRGWGVARAPPLSHTGRLRARAVQDMLALFAQRPHARIARGLALCKPLKPFHPPHLHPQTPKVWLKQPLVGVDEITARLDVVEALAGDAELRDAVRDALRGEAWGGGWGGALRDEAGGWVFWGVEGSSWPRLSASAERTRGSAHFKTSPHNRQNTPPQPPP